MTAKKYQKYSNDPLTQEELDVLMHRPFHSLNRLKNCLQGDGVDWYNVGWALLLGVYVSEKKFDESTTVQFRNAWRIAELIFERHVEPFQDIWSVTEAEAVDLLCGLEGIHEILKTVDRHTLIYGSHRARGRTAGFIRRHDKAAAKYETITHRPIAAHAHGQSS